MFFQDLPLEIRVLILGHAINPYFMAWRSGRTPQHVVWKHTVSASLLVCKDWNAIVRDRLKTVPPEHVISRLTEALAFPVVKHNINRIAKLDEDESMTEPDGDRDDDINKEDLITQKLGYSLICSIDRGFRSCVGLLLEAGVNVNFNDWGAMWPPLLIAFYVDNMEIAKLLLSHGADLYMNDEDDMTYVGYSVLCGAAKNSLLSLATRLLDRGVPARLDSLDKNPLTGALSNNDVEMAIFLLDRGASFLNETKPKILPLSVAVRACSVGTISMLIDRGADINACDSQEATPLTSAIAHNETVAKFLIEHGAVIKADHIREAVKQCSLPFLQTLVDKAGADWAAKVALEEAVLCNKVEHVGLLVLNPHLPPVFGALVEYVDKAADYRQPLLVANEGM
ncbi:uncharacterized protein PADG_01216 [Paracoccidioides brasiliensis Pb18]|uniref:Uncharacterized protein n=1 Tax=Paracoccidioides brasiliensis (strain Pb18) TaxID=502780 RepID=C1G2Q0_PARBD|nr:uncharacterized protein PADG_01216 [Paracoccidioides brasiliensis Pb18]EEH45066.2 hypothetical protein PADG_01216 [Paracoccidioides brasiliensis Pb18]